MSFIAGLSLGFVLGCVACNIAFKDDAKELKQLRIKSEVQKELEERDRVSKYKREKEQKTDG